MNTPVVDVTIVTPVYNCAEHVDSCIESVARQTGVTIEHILVDDASTDGSLRKIREEAAQRPHLKVIPLDENVGQARARNAGLDAASGAFILFLDADDMLHQDTAVAEVLEKARQNDADLTHFQYLRYFEGEPETLEPAVNALTGLEAEGETAQSFPRIINNTSCWQMMYRRAFLDDNAIRFSSRLRQREDRPFFTECILRAERINVCQTQVVRYQVRNTSTMRTLDQTQLALFNTHIAVVGETMATHAAGPQNAELRRANMLYYMNVVFNYWRPYLLKRAVWNSPELQDFLTAWRGAGWPTEDLWQDKILGQVSRDHHKSGYFDVLAFLLTRQENHLAHRLLSEGRLTAAEQEKLHRRRFEDEARPASGFHLSKEALARFCAEKPPRMSAPLIGGAGAPLPPIVLHVGATKTGSSMLQKFCELNRFDLLRDAGIYYPFFGLENGRGPRANRTSGHATLIEYILHDSPDWRGRLAAEVRQLDRAPETLILSSENIVSSRFWQDGRVVDSLARAFGSDEISIIGYLRDPLDWLESMYLESVTSPGIRYKHGIETFVKEQEETGLLDFEGIYQRFVAAFPGRPVHFRPYDATIHHEGGTVGDFFNLIGHPVTGRDTYTQPPERLRNRSAPRAALPYIRAANKVPMSRTASIETARDLIELVRDRVDDPEPKRGFLPLSLAQELAARYRKKNAAFFAGALPDRGEPSATNHGREDTIPADMLDAFACILAENISHGDPQPRTSVEPAPDYKNLEAQKAFRAYVDAENAKDAARPNAQRQLRLTTALALFESGLFDFTHYLNQHPEAENHPGGPVFHYVDTWKTLMAEPNKAFSTRDYIMLNADVAEAGVNPFYHYVAFGQNEGRKVSDG
ncbi:glycosyltransferase family 2 protein [Thalassorhabdomicrobium marinisediminis]|uniref:glycosyltransferase family 2 protein n=1 Tax=Thalassorhabdomicrobium marinisediminis TaxID=2170577 RepID=UPI0024928648|nr:glycosyltransferase family 2 protein [Thalassorhabdomicrobium marinisediminis]